MQLPQKCAKRLTTSLFMYPVCWNGFFGIGWEMRLEAFSVASGRRGVNGKP